MHPDDVAEYVAEGVSELRRRAAEHSEFEIGEIELVERFRVYVPVCVRSRPSVTVGVGQGIVVPGRGMIRQQLNVPDLGRVEERQIVLRVGCEDFDGEPPTAELLDSEWRPLPLAAWPRDPQGRGIVAQHPVYGRPFFCRPQLREYHIHPQHEDDPWDRYREGASLAAIAIGLVRDLRERFILH